jgi:glycosyltransferase involved in cell wall biosynthesis
VAPPVRFTVVVPVYDGATLVGRAVRSVLAQELSDLELVVVDDGSADGSAAAARAAAAGDPRARIVTRSHAGRSATRNAGAALAGGRYLVFLDADDEAKPAWLTRLWAVSGDGEAEIVHCGADRVPVDGSAATVIHPVRYGPLFAHQLGPFRPGMFAVRTERFREVGGYADDVAWGENYELGLRLAHAAAAGGWPTTAVDEPLVVVHFGRADQAAYDRDRYESARVMLARHRDKLRAAPGALSAQYAVLGVNAARLGRRREAVAALARAIAADPRRGANYPRLVRAALGRAGRVQSRGSRRTTAKRFRNGASPLPDDSVAG